MDRHQIAVPLALAWLPRTRGDGPWRNPSAPPVIGASPHTRGWTPAWRIGREGDRGFPAHAGMDPGPARSPSRRRRLPRTRGDGPEPLLCPAPPDWASPHTRGWTRGEVEVRVRLEGFPAHAGMDPSHGTGAPPANRLPRTRGDGPRNGNRVTLLWKASPHTRGWTRDFHEAFRPRNGFPAHAGMDRARQLTPGSLGGLPRTRGDGPSSALFCVSVARASPHTRGWTPKGSSRRSATSGFPAHAGMDPRTRRRSRCRRWLPRTRGDGP